MRCRVCAKDVRGSLSLPAVEVQAQDKRAEGCAALQILPAKARTKHVALLDRVGVQDASNQQITVKQVSLMHDDPYFSHEWV